MSNLQMFIKKMVTVFFFPKRGTIILLCIDLSCYNGNFLLHKILKLIFIDISTRLPYYRIHFFLQELFDLHANKIFEKMSNLQMFIKKMVTVFFFPKRGTIILLCIDLSCYNGNFLLHKILKLIFIDISTRLPYYRIHFFLQELFDLHAPSIV